MSEGYGVFLTYQDATGLKVTINREDAATTISEARVLFGDEATDRIKSHLAGVLSGGVKVAPAPAPVAPPASSQADAPYDPSSDADVQQFELCNKCGSVKDKFIPPGVSRKTGKPYNGFYGCSNPTCR